MSKRVVVTGMGVLCSLGSDVGTFWENIKSGKCGVSLIERFDTSDYEAKVASEIKNFDPTKYMDRKEAKRMDTFTQYAMAAAKQAVEGSKLQLEKEDPYRMGVIVGSGVGGLETLEEQHSVLMTKGPGRVSPFFITNMISNMGAGRIAIEYGMKGFNECVVTACATGNNAIGDAFKKIQAGTADVIVTGGSEAALTRMALAGFCSNKSMTTSTDPITASRPFDADRDGFVLGEGAGILVLEDLEHAINRNAEIYGEIVGYGCTCDAHHITAPDPSGESGAKCMQFALKDAGITPEDIGYINAHGTSTPLNDYCETNVIKKVFGDHAYKLSISSTKSMTGHLLGAAGAVEAIITLLALKEGFLPPTINYKTPDPNCDLDYIPNQGRKSNVTYAISNALGFGGHNAALVFKKYEE